MSLDLLVQIAPGVPPTADLSGRKFTDITAYARARIHINPRGRPDEASQTPPSKCELRLDNEDGRFVARNILAPWYPLLRRGTPLRVRLRRAVDAFARTVSNGWGTSTTGKVWTPYNTASAWSVGSNVGSVSISAVNALRRILYGATLLDAEQRISITPSVALTGASLVWRTIFRYRDTDNYYSCSVECDRNSGGGLTVTCKIRRTTLAAGTVEIAVASPVPGLLYTAGQPVHLVAAVAGPHLGVKAWVGDPVTDEPDAWACEVDDFAHTTRGLVGQEVYLAFGNTNTLPYTVTADNYSLIVDRFTGPLDELPVKWAPGETDTYIDATASGITRRINQGNPPLRSALYRLLTRSSPAAYWPFEDGVDSTQAASGIQGGAPMVVRRDVMDFVSDSPPGAAGSAHPEVDADNALSGPIVGGSATAWQMSVWTKGVESGISSYYVAAEVRTTTGKILRLIMQNASDIAGIGQYDTEASTTPTNFQTAAFSTFGAAMDGNWHLIQATFTQSGANVAASFYYDGTLASSGTWLGVTLGAPISGHAIGRFGGSTGTISQQMSEIYVDHLAVHNTATLVNQYQAGLGYPGELASTRIARLCAEEDIPAYLDELADTTAMGPQAASSLMTLLRECADTDGGILYERTGGQVGYLPATDRLNQAVDWALNYGDLAPPFEPVDDDRDVRNDVTASRPNGSTARYVDDADVLAEGRYTDQRNPNPADDADLANIASWWVHLGTDDDLRYPRIPLNLIDQDDLVDAWLSCDVGSRITIANPPAELATALIDQIIEGYEETLDAVQWDVSLTCAPARGWDVATIDGEQRIPADGSVIGAGGIGLGGLSMLLTSTAENGLWTTDPADFPMNLRLGWFEGEVATATGISGGVSPQTVTFSARGVNGVTRAWAAETPVDVEHPAIVAL